eukprot:gene8534-981_t
MRRRAAGRAAGCKVLLLQQLIALLLLASVCLGAGQVPPSQDRPLKEAYGEVLNTFAPNITPQDDDVQKAVRFALKHLHFNRQQQCFSSNKVEIDSQSLSNDWGDYAIMFVSKHILFQTKNGAERQSLNVPLKLNQAFLMIILMTETEQGVTYYFTLRWERACWQDWATPPDNTVWLHHFGITKDKNQTLSVVTHYTTQLSREFDPTLAAWQSSPGDYAVVLENKHWYHFKPTVNGKRRRLDQHLRLALAYERGMEGKIVTLAPMQVRNGIIHSCLPPSVMAHTRWIRKGVTPCSLKIASYNIWNVNEYENGQYEMRMRQLTRNIRELNPDIIAFQEANMLEGLLPEYHFVFQPAMSYPEKIFQRVEEGVAVFSKYPIVHVEEHLLFRDRSNPVDTHQRVLLKVQVLSPQSYVISIFVTHFSLDERARNEGCIQTWHTIREDNADVQLLLGDLNAEPTTTAIRFLTGKALLGSENTNGLFDVWTHLHPEPIPENSENENEDQGYGLTFSTLDDSLIKRIDYALLRSLQANITVRSVATFPRALEKTPSSDHLGLILEII